jgi:hypothetical protein
MPQFGAVHDDSIYYVSAKAWASGQGHRIVSLPGEPWQTKYPPLYPLLLSIVWRVAPEFPSNLKAATVFAWMLLPPLLWLIRVLYRRYTFPPWGAWLMIAVLAVNPYVQLFSRSLFSEILFTVLLLGVLLLAPKWAAVAGVLAGLAYLTRTAGLPLLVAIPCVYAMRREWRRAFVFAATMLPFVLAWSLWSGAHKLRNDDLYLMYYVDYVAYEFYNVTSSNFLVVLWKNFDAVLTSMGSLVLPFSDSGLEKILTQTIAVAMIAGIYRLARDREEVRAYAIYFALFALMLVLWHYPPNARFLFPVFPLLLAGFAYQLMHTATIVRKAYADPKQKAAAVVFALALASIAFPILRNNLEFILSIAPAAQRAERVITRENTACAVRIDTELPSGARIASHQDATLNLLTGRTSMRMTIPPIYWYEDRFDDMVNHYARIPQIAREHGMTHFMLNRRFHADLSDDQHRRFLGAIDHSSDVRELFRCGEAVVYEIR